MTLKQLTEHVRQLQYAVNVLHKRDINAIWDALISSSGSRKRIKRPKPGPSPQGDPIQSPIPSVFPSPFPSPLGKALPTGKPKHWVKTKRKK